jgi:hypothetical protein
MKMGHLVCAIVVAALVTGCGSAQRKVNKSEAELNKERLSLIEDYKKCIKKAGEDETKAAACERYREAADSLSK